LKIEDKLKIKSGLVLEIIRRESPCCLHPVAGIKEALKVE
jgi:hypothetical protein